MKKKMVLLLVVSLVLFTSALFITGCGGGGDNGGPGPGPGPGDPYKPGDPGPGSFQPKLSATISFNIAGAESLVATENAATQTPASALGKMAQGLGLRQKSFTFHESGQNRSAALKAEPLPGEGGATNLFAVKADGTMDFALKIEMKDENGDPYMPPQDQDPNMPPPDPNAPPPPDYYMPPAPKVMYSVLSKKGDYVYIAFEWPPTEDNCAIYKVKIADNTQTCLDPGYMPQDVQSYQDYYSRKINGNVKPIQLDEAGNVYYMGFKMQDPNNRDYYMQSPVVRKVSAEDGTATSLTSDMNFIQSFLVMKSGVLVYTYQNWNSGMNDAGIKMYDPVTGSTNKLTDDNANQWWGNMFYSVDDHDTVVFGSADSMAGGVFFGQRYGNTGGRYVVKLDTSLFGNNSGNGWTSAPTRLIIGDDGNLYGLFIESVMKETGDPNTPPQSDNYLKLYQVLPYAGTPKASVKLASQDWWTAMNGVDTQVSKGYAYMAEKEKNVSGIYSDRTIIKVFNFSDGTIAKLLSDDAWSQRYEIYAWKLVGDMINFSGFDTTTSKMVMGTIDTIKVKNGEPSSSYLNVKPVASAAGASAKVQDMEVLKPSQPVNDTSDDWSVKPGGLFADSENLYSASVKFTKYMDKDMTDTGVHLRKTADSSDVPAMKVWFYQTLHLIVDADGTTTGETKPLAWGTEYALSIDPTIKDAWGWGRNLLQPESELFKSFTTRPATGWYIGMDSIPDEVPAWAVSGSVGKYVGNTDMSSSGTVTVIRLVEDSQGQDGYFRVQFSARNKSWGELEFALRDHNITQNSWERDIVRLTMHQNGFWYDAKGADGQGVWGNNGNNWNMRVFSSFWTKYTLDLYGGTMTLTVDYLDGTAPVKLIDRQDLRLYTEKCQDVYDQQGQWSWQCTPTTSWDLDFRINSSAVVFDNFRVIKLDASGNETDSAIVDEDFSTSIDSALTNLTSITW